MFWIGDPTVSPSKVDNSIKDLKTPDASPTTIWKSDEKVLEKAKIAPGTLSGKSSSYQPLFGRHAVDIPVNIDEDSAISTIKIISKDITTICSQDIYQSFICYIAEYFELEANQTTITTEQNALLLEHQVVTKLIDCFEANSLGSRQDAYLVIITALWSRSGLPRSKEAIPIAYRVAEELRKGNKFKEAEEVLRLVWENISEPGESQCNTIIELGELYRYAIFSKGGNWRDFGEKGINWLHKQIDSQMVNEKNIVIDRYVGLTKRPRESRTGEDVLKAILRKEREETLWSIS